MLIHDYRHWTVVICIMPLRRHITTFLWCALITVFTAVRAHSMNLPVLMDGDPIVLVYADEYSVRMVDSVSIRELSGRVHLTHGNVTVYCDKATHYPGANLVVLRGSVRILQGTMTMMMPRGEYDGTRSIATGYGGVRITDRSMLLRSPGGVYNSTTAIVDFADGVCIEDDSLTITSEHGRYERTTQESWAWGDVVIRNKKSAVVLTGDSAYNRPADRYSMVSGNAVMQQTDSADQHHDIISDSIKSEPSSVPKKSPERKGRKRTNSIQPSDTTRLQTTTTADTGARRDATVQRPKDTVTIRAQRMEAFREPGREWYDAKGQVEIVRGKLAATGSSCRYNNFEEHFLLRGTPVVWADSLTLSADSVDLQFRRRQLTRVDAKGSAFMLMKDSSSGSRSQQIAAETIVIEVKDDTIRLVSGVRNASSLYFMEGDSGPSGVSRTACDSLFIVFTGGEADTVVWRSGVTSEYYPENLIGDGVQQYYLPSYRDSGTRPKKARLDSAFAKEAEIRQRCESGVSRPTQGYDQPQPDIVQPKKP